MNCDKVNEVIAQKIGLGPLRIRDALSKETPTGALDKVKAMFAHFLTNIIILGRAYNIFNKAERELYSNLRNVNKGEQTISMYEIDPVEDCFFLPARVSFLEFANSLEKLRSNEKTTDKVNRFGSMTISEAPWKDNHAPTCRSQAGTLLELMEWSHIQKDRGKGADEIQRVCRQALDLPPEIKPVSEKDVEECGKMFLEMYTGKENKEGMHQAFYNFRKEIIEHQRSYERAKNGFLRDEGLLKAHDAMMDIFSCFSDQIDHPMAHKMLKVFQGEEKASIQSTST